jgi:hypothetical protein
MWPLFIYWIKSNFLTIFPPVILCCFSNHVHFIFAAAKSAMEKEAFRDKLMERGALIVLVTHASKERNR